MSTATVLTVPAEPQWYDDALRAALAFAPYEETFVDEMARWRKLKQTTGDNSWWGILSALCNVWPGAYPEYSREETKAVIHSDTLPDGSGIRWAVVECDMMPFFEAQRPSGETVHFRHCWLAKEAERVLGWPATKFPEYTPDEDGGKPWLFAWLDGHPINSPATLQMNTRPAVQAGLFEEASL